MTERFFAAEEQVSEVVRAALDAAWGLPSNGQETCYTPAIYSPRDSEGRVLLAVPEDFCNYHAVTEILPGLLRSGAVAELGEAEYRQAVASNSGTKPDPDPDLP